MNTESDEGGDRGRLSPRHGLIAAAANVNLLVARLDCLILSFFDDSEEPELKHPAFESLYEELSEIHGLAIDVHEGIQSLLDQGLTEL